MRRQGGLFPVLLLALMAVPAAAAEKKVAVFDFELIDTSLEGEINGVDPAQTQRLTLLAPRLRADIDGEANFSIVDVTPVAEEAGKQVLRKCDKCVLALGKDLGADIVVTGTVQKVSNLILNINAYGHEVATGKLVAQGSADIRGNNDEMWGRGVEALWKNTLKKQFTAIEAAQ
ncbi:hypothetical protein Sa4125_38630 [Aureimonas sp. SA4125]|uniref:DUF3280 domain-containing protein n=1 Tax=Aureimonas sp. SA4125 TaxID=2826993 RepID=UPI001CC75155|nr:DUF3280 domain-containing protein [Aureimonas sp. SA4125]BDA86321.1 hypothetical protein Sa4125_38630 [Aureimonas sp. SA4125]